MHETWKRIGVAPLLLLACACARVEAEQSRGPQARPTARSNAHGRAEGEAFWWTRLGEISAATVWFGPVIDDPNGRPIRYWTLTYASAGAPQPLAYFQSVIDIENADPIGAKGGLFDFQLRPHEGRTWGDVIGVEDLVVEATWPD